MKKLIRTILCFTTFSLAAQGAFAAAPDGRTLPAEIQEGVILHCFDWKLTDIITELPAIASAGFGAVQISPQQRNVKVNDIWYDVYRPYDYRQIDNGMGSRQDIVNLCNEAAKYGIKVIVDVVANHGTMKNEAHDPWWDVNGRMTWPTQRTNNTRYGETHYALGDYGETNSDDPEVQQRTKAYIDDLKSLGVKGIRWDAAKHITLPSEGCEFWNVVTADPDMWHYGEILGGPAGSESVKLMKEYASLMSVTDTYMNGTSAKSYWGTQSLAPERCVYWAESHDTFSNTPQYGGTSNGTPQADIDRTWALVASRKGATALYLSRPTTTNVGNIRVGAKGSMNFKEKHVAAVNHFHNAMAGRDEAFAESGNAKAILRGKGAVVVRQGGGSVSIPAASLDPTAVYKDEVTGNTWTLANGTLSGTIDSSTGIAVVYDYEKMTAPAPYVSADPSIGEIGDTPLTVTLTLHNASTGSYSIDGGASVTFTGSTTVTVGANTAPGATATIDWTATSVTETESGRFTYTKADPDAKVYVYLHYEDDWSGPFYCYIYNSDNSGDNGGWPGKQMDSDDNLTINGITGGWYKYEVPEKHIAAGMAMVTDNKDNGNRYPANGQPGMPIGGKSIAFMHHGGTWTVTYDLTVAGMENIEADNTPRWDVTVNGGGQLTFNGTSECAIYDINGRTVSRLAPGASATLAPGLYIVRSANISKKLIIK